LKRVDLSTLASIPAPTLASQPATNRLAHLLDRGLSGRQDIIMSDNTSQTAEAPLGLQIRRLREARGWTLSQLARKAGTSAPALHRYEGGWDRFEMATLRRIASALDAWLEVRLVPAHGRERPAKRPSRRSLVKILSPLFWDKDLAEHDLDRYGGWVISRVLVFGNREQVLAVRHYFGEKAMLEALGRRDVDVRTRNYWKHVLGEGRHAPESSGR
jgi:transcriptional regulator with XRE-family HTH domain